jgi:DNA mismatch endonuclease, patch repair protein
VARRSDEPFASSPGVRRRMQAVRSRDTAAELALRRLLHARGLRYRVDAPPLAGLRRRADLVFAGPRVAVFVDGCFWHGCPEHGRRRTGVNEWYWPGKIAGNVARDRDTDRRLADAGWRVVRVWEHDDVDRAADRVEAAVRAGRGDSGGGVADALPRRPA